MPNNRNGNWPQRHREAVAEGRERHRNQEEQARLEEVRRALEEANHVEALVANARQELGLGGLRREWLWVDLGLPTEIVPRVHIEVDGESWGFPDDLETLSKVYKQIGEKLEQRMQNT